jgi:hypothetical protein
MVVSVALISIRREVFIRVQRGVIDLVKSITRQVLVGRPSHVAGRPWSSVSTDLQLGIPLPYLLQSVTAKTTHERLQGGAGQTGGLAGRTPLGPTSQRPLHIASLCQVHPQGNSYFGGILNLLGIS